MPTNNLPAASEVRAALDKLQNSDPFVRSHRIRRLLVFLVETVLEGNQEHLKESLIGVEVFDRSPDYDSKQDPVVRVEMRRLRSKLSEYYLQQGKSDEVLIWLEKGSYIPILSRRVTDVSAASATDPPAASPVLETVHESAAPTSVAGLPSARKRGFSRTLRIATICFVLAVAIVFAILLSRHVKPQRSLRLYPLAGNAGLETSPAFSPDSKQVAYSWDGNRRNFDIYVKPIEGGSPHRLTDNAAHDIDPSWSPDGRQIAFMRVSPDKAEVLVIPSTGGIEKLIGTLPTLVNPWHPEEPENNGAGGPVWSPDGSYLLVAGSTEKNSGGRLLKMSLDGKEQRLTAPPAGTNDTSPRISPSGDAIAFVRNWGVNSFDLCVMSSRGGNPVRLTFDSRDIQGLDWLDDDKILYSSNRAGNFHLWQIARSGGEPRSFSAGGAQPQWPAVSRDGHWLAFMEPVSDARIWRLALTGERQQAAQEDPFLSSAGQDYSPDYSPDGKKIAFVSDRSGALQIWTADSDGLDVIQLTSFKGESVGSPHWSPDSRRLVFDGGSAQSAIWLIDADGSNLHRVNNDSRVEYLPTWSRDGQWIYFCWLRDGHVGLWKQNPDSGQAVQLTKETFFDAIESPDGRPVYVQRPHGGTWQFPVGGGVPTPVRELGDVYSGRYWALAENTIYFVPQEKLPHMIETLNLATGKIQQIAVIPTQLMVGTPGLSVSPDLKWLLFVQRDQRRSSIVLQER